MEREAVVFFVVARKDAKEESNESKSGCPPSQ